MPSEFISRMQRRPVPFFTVALFAILVTGMVWLRFGPLANSPVNIGYGLPLLVCLWYPERRLLWSLMGAYIVISVIHVFVITPPAFAKQPFFIWGIQMVNLLIIALSVHVMVDLLARLRAQKTQLEEFNLELMAKEDEITRQNEALQKQSEELQKANSDLDSLVIRRTEELQELVNELEHFSYTITHDLRAPLRAMIGFGGLLAEECRYAPGSAGRDYLNRIITASARMDRLITDALSYSQIARQNMPLQTINTRRLLTGIIESYPAFQESKARIEIADGLPAVLGNEAGLTQCFSNLLGNALKFVAPGTVPHVRIGGERRGNRVLLWCEDNGIGIPADLQSRVFIMFQRLSKDYEGTGIGLALVKKVVERMGGTVGVESEPGRGSRFWIELSAPGFPSS